MRDLEATTNPQPILRPGERLLHGAVHIFDLNLRNAHLSIEAVRQAPADLSGLTRSELAGLLYSAMAASAWDCRIDGGPELRARAHDLINRVHAERAARGLDSSGASLVRASEAEAA